MRFVLGHLQKGCGVKSFAHQSTLHVDNTGQDSVNLTIGNLGFEFLKRHAFCQSIVVIQADEMGQVAPSPGSLAVTIRTSGFLHIGVVFAEDFHNFCLCWRFRSDFIPEFHSRIFNLRPFFIWNCCQLHFRTVDPQ